MTYVIDNSYMQCYDGGMNEKEPIQRSMSDGARPADPDPCVSRIPLSMTQKTAARRMLQSARDIPQFSVSMELDTYELDALRHRINSDIEDKESRISITALLIWLTARALRKHPRLNGRFDVRNLRLVDVADVVACGCSLDVEFLEFVVLEDRDAALLASHGID